MKRAAGGFATTEMAILFPVCFLILMVLLQSAISMSIRLFTFITQEQAVMVYEERRMEGMSTEEAVDAGEEWMRVKTEEIPGLRAAWQFGKEDGFLEEAILLDLDASYHALTTDMWQHRVKRSRIDPVTFRNRVDLVVEIIGDISYE